MSVSPKQLDFPYIQLSVMYALDFPHYDVNGGILKVK